MSRSVFVGSRSASTHLRGVDPEARCCGGLWHYRALAKVVLAADVLHLLRPQHPHGHCSNSASLLLLSLGILAVSVAAKFGACYLAARLAGEDNRTALGIGA